LVSTADQIAQNNSIPIRRLDAYADHNSETTPLSKEATMNAHTLATPRSLAAAPIALPRPLRRFGADLAAWWRRRRQKRDEALRAAALAPLDPRLLEDIGVSEDLRARALALRESQHERLLRLSGAIGGSIGTPGSW
jgi:hypothetical protein